MKIAIINSSTLRAHDRWDVDFHLTLNELQPRIDQIRAERSVDDVIATIKALRLADKQGLKVLLRSSQPNRSLSQEDADRLAAEYPYLAMAIMERDAKKRIADLKAKMAEDQSALEKLIQLSSHNPA